MTLLPNEGSLHPAHRSSPIATASRADAASRAWEVLGGGDSHQTTEDTAVYRLELPCLSQIRRPGSTTANHVHRPGAKDSSCAPCKASTARHNGVSTRNSGNGNSLAYSARLSLRLTPAGNSHVEFKIFPYRLNPKHICGALLKLVVDLFHTQLVSTSRQLPNHSRQMA